MRAVKQTLAEMVLLTVAATCVALAGNGLRAFRSGPSISIGKNYFDKGEGRIRAAGPDRENQFAIASQPEGDRNPIEASARSDPPKYAGAAVPAVSDPPDQHPEHPYQEVSFDQVASIVKDPNTAMGVNLLVDARNDAAYNDGHLPGAVQLDHYELGRYLENVLYRAKAAEKIVVYCNGGDCEDSIFVCADLIEAGIPYDSLYLYAGGWKEWSARKMPTEKPGTAGAGD